MLVIPTEKKKPEQVHKEFKLMCERLGNNINDDFYLDEESEIKELIFLYNKGIILSALDFCQFISSLEPLKFYKLMMVLTQNSKHNRQVFLDEYGFLDDENSAINRLMK